MSELKLLGPAVRTLLSPAFLTGEAGVDVAKHLRTYHRTVDLEPLRRVVAEAMRRFADAKPETSDAWLSPRVHATLRLTRREAAARDLWNYLSIVELPEYVRWRWGATLDRFVGTDMNQAFSRLWWGSELVRDGGDYSLVAIAFAAQDIPNTWFRLKAFHHRPAAIAAIRIIGELRGGVIIDGKRIKRSKRINLLSTAFNTALTTIVLDAVAPHLGEDAGAIKEWIDGDVDETLMLDELPVGPADEPVPTGSIAATETLLRRVGTDSGLLGGNEIDDDEETAAEPIAIGADE